MKAPQIANFAAQMKDMKQIFFLALIFIIVSCKSDQSRKDPVQAGWRGDSVCEILEDNERLRVLKCTFPPGVGHERHYHSPHFGFTLQGSTFRILDTTGVREISPRSGTHFYSEGVDWHEVMNIGDSTAVFLIMEPK